MRTAAEKREGEQQALLTRLNRRILDTADRSGEREKFLLLSAMRFVAHELNTKHGYLAGSIDSEQVVAERMVREICEEIKQFGRTWGERKVLRKRVLQEVIDHALASSEREYSYDRVESQMRLYVGHRSTDEVPDDNVPARFSDQVIPGE